MDFTTVTNQEFAEFAAGTAGLDYTLFSAADLGTNGHYRGQTKGYVFVEDLSFTGRQKMQDALASR
jgi:hypothetical protein